MCRRYCDPRDLRQTTWGGPGDGRVSTVQQKFPVVDDAGTSRRSGEERPPGSLAVTVGQLGPVLQGEHSGRDRDTFHLVCGGRHVGGWCGAAAHEVEKKLSTQSGDIVHRHGLSTNTNYFMTR